MKRLPIIPTLIVAAAVAVMIGLGIWQLQRAGWKERMLTELTAAESKPAIDLDPLLDDAAPPADLAFRRALITCDSAAVAPEQRAGRNLKGQSGYSAFVPCRPGASGWAGRIRVNASWAAFPDSALRITLPRTVAGRIGTVDESDLIILTAAEPASGLQASAPPRIEDIPNNHMGYAFQWFFFAATAAAIYLLALRRRRPRAPSEP